MCWEHEDWTAAHCVSTFGGVPHVCVKKAKESDQRSKNRKRVRHCSPAARLLPARVDCAQFDIDGILCCERRCVRERERESSIKGRKRLFPHEETPTGQCRSETPA